MSQKDVTIYHNPRCSKSRESLQILEEKGVAHQVVKYLEETPSIDELRQLIQLLGIAPRDLLRTGESAYKDNGLDNQDLDDESILQAMHDNPILIERPIVVRGGQAVIGRPPSLVLDLIN